MKLKSLNPVLPPDLRIQDRYQASRLTLCPREPGAEYRRQCLDRKCNNCGTHQLSHHLDAVLQTNRSSPATWFQWEQAQIGQGKTRLMKIRHETTLEGLVEALEECLSPFSLHLFNAKWQSMQYKSVATTCPANTIIFCEDFAENDTCRPQDAPQGCHRNNTQCTIHPVVASYNCAVDNCSDVITDSIIFISDDLTHDHHAVQHFVRRSVQLLKEEGIPFNNLIQFSDGTPTQYKNRIAFADVSFAEQDIGIGSERHFFGSRHGKGPCDREIGVVKKSVSRQVAARQVEVASAHDLFTMCRERLSLPRTPTTQDHHHSKRRFVYVDKSAISRQRPDRTDTKPLKNTRKLHCVKAIEPYTVTVRELSCLCPRCREGGPCLNTDITGPWTVSSMQTVRRRHTAGEQAEPTPPPPHQADPAPAPQLDQAQPPPTADMYVSKS